MQSLREHTTHRNFILEAMERLHGISNVFGVFSCMKLEFEFFPASKTIWERSRHLYKAGSMYTLERARTIFALESSTSSLKGIITIQHPLKGTNCTLRLSSDYDQEEHGTGFIQWRRMYWGWYFSEFKPSFIQSLEGARLVHITCTKSARLLYEHRVWKR